jgi:hypothetical protein
MARVHSIRERAGIQDTGPMIGSHSCEQRGILAVYKRYIRFIADTEITSGKWSIKTTSELIDCLDSHLESCP